MADIYSFTTGKCTKPHRPAALCGKDDPGLQSLLAFAREMMAKQWGIDASEFAWEGWEPYNRLVRNLRMQLAEGELRDARRAGPPQ